MTLLLVPKVEKCSTHAPANQIAFHANTAAQVLANQIAFMLMSKEREAQKNSKLCRLSYFYIKVVLVFA